ncbi:lysosome-associated membrane glycoprotein 3-like [Patiria miniata]|uniref:Uncharacterized protein n=1 Tax=Patiria miniata TaxID=46514 RepID=A0A913ZI36_PATMI|nr:lysosome-associated membrane glycoprotein 3-like [Patiria miniata]
MSRMNASVLCLFLVIAGGTTLVSATAPASTKNTAKVTVPTTAQSGTTVPNTTHSLPTTAPKTTHSQPTAAAKTTHSRPTTVPKTTHSHPTTVTKTTHSHPTTAPNTTHSQPTTAPKTTHSRPTTAPKTTQSHPTTVPTTTPHVPETTAHHTPGNATTSSTHTTAAAGNTTSNATGSTVGTTTPASTNPTVPRPEYVIPSYQCKNGSKVCMLLVFNATLKIKYDTTNGKSGEATLPIGGKINGKEAEWNTTSSCEDVVPRIFRVRAQYPVPDSNAIGIVSMDFQFGIFGTPPYSLVTLIMGDWTYTEPFFPRDSVNYGKRAFGAVQVEMGTMGKTFGCQTLNLTQGPLTIILDHVMLQPFADFANGTFGDVEECKTNPTTMEPTTATASPHPPSKPSPSNGGMIAGIVIGVLAFVVLIIGIAVFVVRKRRMKEAAYGHLDEEHKDYVH